MADEARGQHNEHVMDKFARTGDAAADAVAHGASRSAAALKSIAAATGLPGLAAASYTPRSIQGAVAIITFALEHLAPPFPIRCALPQSST